jgi:REP element-mobilizing transposase RayT
MTERFNRGDAEGVLHFITINVRGGARPFVHDAYVRCALEQLRTRCQQHPARLAAYVVMPTHLHFTINPRDGKASLFVRLYKQAVTEAFQKLAIQLGQDAVLRWLSQPDGHPELWQDGKHDFHLYSQRLIWQKIDYIHNNPVRARLVTHAYDYPYSSFRAWYEGYGEPILPIDRDFWWTDLG